jgi:hypothetical protein
VEALLPEGLRRVELKTRYNVEIKNITILPAPKSSLGPIGVPNVTSPTPVKDEKSKP